MTDTQFIAPTVEWAYLVPLLVVLGAGVLGVLVEAFVPAWLRRDIHVVLTVGALLVATVNQVMIWGRPEVSAIRDLSLSLPSLTNNPSEISLPVGFTAGVSVFSFGQAGDSGTAMGAGQSTAVYVADPWGIAIQTVILVLALIAVIVIAARPGGQDDLAPSAAAIPGSAYEELARRKGLQQTEAFPLILFAVGGMMIFTSTANLLVMFVALEVLSLPLYVLTAMARRRRLLAQEASLKYFLLGAFASALFLFGTALIYGYAGSVDLRKIFARLFDHAGVAAIPAIVGDNPQGQEIVASLPDVAPMYALVGVGIFLILVGLLFKVGVVPFHTWTPDVYQGAPTGVTGFMAACTKAAAVGALARVLYLLATPMIPEVREYLWMALAGIAVLTMLVGSVIAVVQTDIKRMLAYSSIAHAGFILVAILGFAPGQVIESTMAAEGGDQIAQAWAELSTRLTTSASATAFYLLAYGIATVGAFAVVTLVRERAVTSVATVPHSTHGADEPVILGEATRIAQWAGLGKRSPWLAGSFAVFLLSMAGIPLTAGFIAKFGAFRASIDAGLPWLAVVGVLASAIAVFFYARIIVLMFFTSPSDEPEQSNVVVVRSTATAIAIAVCVIGVILLGVMPSWILDLANQAAKFAL